MFDCFIFSSIFNLIYVLKKASKTDVNRHAFMGTGNFLYSKIQHFGIIGINKQAPIPHAKWMRHAHAVTADLNTVADGSQK